jgi:hypothetical protein
MRDYDLDPASISHRLIRHNLAVQQAILTIPGVRSYMLESAMGELDTLDGKRPDALIELEAYPGRHVALEVELTEKRGRDLDQTIWRNVQALAQAKYLCIIYVTDQPCIVGNYQEAMDYFIDRWRKDGNGKWLRTGETFVVPDQIKSWIRFLCTDKLLKGV